MLLDLHYAMLCDATRLTLCDAMRWSLQIPIHTAPMYRCVIKVAPEGNFKREFALITATKPVAGSVWKAESQVTESGEAWCAR